MRWRVRIGSFENKSLALEVKKRLSVFRGEDPWITFIKQLFTCYKYKLNDKFARL